MFERCQSIFPTMFRTSLNLKGLLFVCFYDVGSVLGSLMILFSHYQCRDKSHFVKHYSSKLVETLKLFIFMKSNFISQIQELTRVVLTSLMSVLENYWSPISVCTFDLLEILLWFWYIKDIRPHRDAELEKGNVF